MSSLKRTRSNDHLAEEPPSKRQHTNNGGFKNRLTFDTALADEIVLFIFGYLQARDLCHAEAVSRSWRRLACDEELWKSLFLRSFGHLRLRGGRSNFMAFDRPIIPLPGHGKSEDPPTAKIARWKDMYRVGSNWRTGRNARSSSIAINAENSSQTLPLALLVGRSVTIFSSGETNRMPAVSITSETFTLSLRSRKVDPSYQMRVSSFALDQTVAETSLSLAVFYATSAMSRAHHFSIFDVTTGLKESQEIHIVSSRPSRSPVTHSAFHSTLLIALTATFQIDIYQMPGEAGHKPTLVRSMNSFSSFPPSSLTICRPNPLTHKVLLSYAVPVYPVHWSVATTELQVDDDANVSTTRTLRAFRLGWDKLVEDDESPRTVGSRMEAVTAIQSDGKYLVVAPRKENYMELYRLRQNSLAFIRVLFGPTQPICAISVADARCVSISEDGTIWIFDLDRGSAVEVQEKVLVTDWEGIQLYFDDRRIVIITPTNLKTISFD